MVGVAAGESKDPKKTIPLRLNKSSGVFYCFISCVFSSLVHLIAYDDPRLFKQPHKVKILRSLHLPYCMKKQALPLLQV